MSIPGKVDDISALPEPLREHYREIEGGGYVVDVKPSEDGWAFENVAGIRSALEKERANRSKAAQDLAELRKRAEAFGDLDPEEAREALEKIRAGTLTPKDEMAKREAAVTKRLQEEFGQQISERDEKIQRMEMAMGNSMRDAQIARAAANSGVEPEWISDHVEKVTALRYIENEDGKLESHLVVLNEHGEPRVSLRDASGLMSVEEYVAEVMAADSKWSRLFGLKGQGSGGQDRPGAGRNGPLSKIEDPGERWAALRRRQSLG